MKNFLFLTLLLLVFQQSTLASSHPQHKINIIPEKIAVAEFYEKYTAIGQAKLANSTDYFAKVKGKVDFISSIQGNKIAKGDVVIIIDKFNYKSSTNFLNSENKLIVMKFNYFFC